MNNSDFKYFSWGTHDDARLAFYGLMAPDLSKIYLSSQNYTELKQLQLIAMQSRHLVMVPLTDFPEYIHNSVDNEICFAWGISFRTNSRGRSRGLGHASDYVYTGWDGDKLVDFQTTPTTQDLDTQKNLLFFHHVLTSSNHVRETEQLRVYQPHHNELLHFVNLVLPHDQELVNLIRVDQALLCSVNQSVVKHLCNYNLNDSFDTNFQKFLDFCQAQRWSEEIINRLIN